MNPPSTPIIVAISPKTLIARIARAISARSLITACNESSAEVTSVPMIGAINEALDQSPDWVCIAPFGVYPNPVGLQVVDQESVNAMASAFNSLAGRVQRFFRGLPIFEGHPDDPTWAKSHPAIKAEAVGRIKEVRAGDGGLYAKIAYNDVGRALVSGEAAAYSNQSPRWNMVPTTYKGKRAFRPVELLSLGLTNQPNIPDTAIGLNEAAPQVPQLDSNMKEKIIALLAALGQSLAADATDEQLLIALDAALPVANAAKTATVEATKAKDQAAAASNEATAAKSALAAERTARAELLVVQAINEGRIAAAARDQWVGKLTAAANMAEPAKALSEITPALNTAPLVSGVGGRKQEASTPSTRITAINEAIEAHKKADPNSDHIAAYRAVKAEKPDLFK